MIRPTMPEPESTPKCPICAGATLAPYCRKESYGQTWNVDRCITCGHGFVSNPPTLERLNEIQNDREADTSGSTGDKLAPPNADPENVFLANRIASLTPARGRTLDVGSGGGSSTLSLHQAGFREHLLIDFDPRAAAAVEHIPNSRFERIAFESLSSHDGAFDVIVMSHVLEHSLNPLDWLAHAAKLLSPQGVLAIAIPNFGGVYRFLGEHDPWIIPPVHLQFFTPSSMRLALTKGGMEVTRIASRSGVTLTPVDRTLSLKSKLVRRAWNTLAIGLNHTSRGIVMHAFARRAT